MLVTQMTRDSDDRLPAWAWPGGYPLAYFTQDVSILCPACATADIDAACSGDDARGDDLPMWVDILWEGPAENCDSCNAEMITAYGPVEDDR